MDARTQGKPLSKNRLAAIERARRDELKRRIKPEELREYRRLRKKIAAADRRIVQKEKYAARDRTRQAIKSGELVKTGICYLSQLDVGPENTQMHHVDYNDPNAPTFELWTPVHRRLHIILEAHGVKL